MKQVATMVWNRRFVDVLTHALGLDINYNTNSNKKHGNSLSNINYSLFHENKKFQSCRDMGMC